MRILRSSLNISTRSRFEVIDITSMIENWLRESNVGNGLLLVYTPHTTAALAINEYESGLRQDILEMLKSLTKPDAHWRHNLIDNNAHAHLANVIVGGDKIVPVENGKLTLGTWQRLLFIELDGPRRREVRLVYVGE
ncbi:MAG: secondary thiamine-phosphate synthase enzyme YjbQ [Acidilobaceae archaeon]